MNSRANRLSTLINANRISADERGLAARLLAAITWPVRTSANEITSADGGWRVLFAFVAQWPAAAEFCL
jgi:hypothetical protein